MGIPYPYVTLPELKIRIQHELVTYLEDFSIEFLTKIIIDELKPYHGGKLLEVGEPYLRINDANFIRHLCVDVIIDPNTNVSDDENREIIYEQCIMNQI